MKEYSLHNFRAGGRTLFLLLFFCCSLLQGSEIEFTYDWSGAEKIGEGVLHAYKKLRSPRIMRINVLRIDLRRKDLRFIAAQRDKDWGKPMPDYPHYPIRVTRETPKQFLERLRKERSLDMIAAVNSTGWAPWKREYGVFYKYGCRMGLLISEGVLVEYPHKRPYPVFLITKDRDFQIRMWKNETEDLSGIDLAITGNVIMVKNGKVIPQKHKGTAPRTAYGLSRDKRYLYLLVIDGRFPLISEGATVEETGMIIRNFGAFTAINMDGGGSTMMVLCPEGKKRKVYKCNTSYYNRKVACSLGIYRIRQEK